MNLAALFIKRPVTTTLIMLGIIVFGVMSYRLLPVSDLPTVDFPTIQVGAGLPGASPETMASAVALPLEKQFATIAGLNSINSTSSQGSTNITLQFDLSRNIDAAAQDVQSMIAKTARQLPPQMPAPPSYQKVNPGDQPVLFLVLRSATLPLSTVDEYAETTIAQRISMVSGVAQVQRVRRGEVRRADRRRSAQAGRARRRPRRGRDRDRATPTSTCRPARSTAPDKTFVVQANGQLMRAAAYGPMIVAYRNGNPVRLDEVAHVYDGIENDKSAAWYGGERTHLSRRSRSSRAPTSSQVVDAVKALLPTFREQLPAAVSLDVRTDRSVAIRESVRDVKFTLLLTIGLVVARHLPLPAQRLGDDHPQPRAAGVDRRDLRGDVPARLQPRQPVADGAHALGRLRRRRRDRDAGEHRPAHGDGQAADAGGVRRVDRKSPSPSCR